MPNTPANAPEGTTSRPKASFLDVLNRAERAVQNAAKAAADGPGKVALRKMALQLTAARVEVESADLDKQTAA